MTEEEVLYQACAIPFRQQTDSSIEFCLVTSTRTNEWSFPKGTIKRDETAMDTVLRKAKKEVGLAGKIIAQLGTYSYRKWEMSLEVTALLMCVEKCDDVWEDSTERARKWVKLDEAKQLVRRDELRSLLDAAQTHIESET